ncbi:MAG: hypothetical protein AVDCRST_MAG68-234 [uncultured Gemmatimonadetes bacterium]|uniref:Uncharacterized protein n=1 Tax=uncultured Gemmatimonadota bacterium TaxID=203437 RepID=A0A6J4K8N8_9BACT|nr:MAG: hypothetical protein AVDCRST_MAG68-234 [uncultured Gemmatimonadota bacterium]
MLTYSLQWVVGLLTLTFAVLALRISRPGVSPDPFFGSAWLLAGTTFLLHAASQLAQYAWGGLALAGGAGSAAMESYLRWSPTFNHTRTFVLLALFIALMALAGMRAPPGRGFQRAYGVALLAAMTLGVIVAADEGKLVESRHYLRVAGWDTVELIVVLSALFATLVTDKVDRYLWGALAANAFAVTLSIIWFVALSRVTDPLAWSPPAWQIAGYRVAVFVVMVALAARRLWLVRRGRVAEGLLGSRTKQYSPYAG